jgi:hypothetical protein
MSNNETLKEIGRASYSAIAEMVAALNCDYGRLEELKDSEELTEAETEELIDLEKDAGECSDRDDALQWIHDDALSVEVRSGWASLGDTLTAEEFRIVITTGGPAVQIRGELDESLEPRRAWLEIKDWGTPWTQYFEAEQETLLDYAGCFYFGE